MDTDTLIDGLANELHPVSANTAHALLRNGHFAGAAIAGAGVVFWPSLGVRPDIAAAMATGIFWVKLLYGGSIALLGFGALKRLSQPDSEPVRWAGLLALPLVVLAAVTAFELSKAPANGGETFWMGSSWVQCPLYVAGLSVPVFSALHWSLSRLAPTRLATTGAAAGLVAGATGATVYALHCAESSPGFVFVWYSVGLGAASLLGSLLGPRLLRW